MTTLARVARTLSDVQDREDLGQATDWLGSLLTSTKVEHQHTFTVPVEYRALNDGPLAGFAGTPWAPMVIVTKLRCAGPNCTKEVDRGN